MQSPIEILSHIAMIMDGLGVPYFVVGSVASSLHGFSRATNDVDIVADIKIDQVSQLASALKDMFYIDEQAIRRAILNRRSFNAIHLDSLFKVDVYVPGEDEFSQQQMKRRRPENLSPDSTQAVYLATPEDIILAKLLWYRQGGEISDRQWTDVLGVVKVQGDRLNEEYLREWADHLGVSDLLSRALGEAK